MKGFFFMVFGLFLMVYSFVGVNIPKNKTDLFIVVYLNCLFFGIFLYGALYKKIHPEK